MTTAECPSCGTFIEVGGKVTIGQQVICSACDSVLEVIWLDPVELDWTYGDDEDLLEEEDDLDEEDFDFDDSDD